MAEQMRFDDDVVLVTGAGRGLGREHVLAFAARGAKVVVNDLDGDVAQSVVDEVEALGGRAVVDTHSVADEAGAEAIVATALEAFGTLTVVVNNAGVISYAPFGEITEKQWRLMEDVTFNGTYYVSRAAWRVFSEKGYGRLVNVTSNAGFAGNETLVHYGAAKLGVAGLTKGLSHEVGDRDIRVNAIAPMAVTRMNREAFFGGKESQGTDWQADIREGRVPMGPPEIVSPTVLWLAHRSTTVNGEIFSTSSGKVGRVAFVVGEGYFNPDHTPEDLRDNVGAIRALGDFLDATSTGAELALIPPLFQKG